MRDDRIVQLDRIVREVKESDEWEEVQMTIYDLGVEKGKEQGIEQGIEQGRVSLIRTMLMDDHTVEEVAALVHEKPEVIQKIKDDMTVNA